MKKLMILSVIFSSFSQLKTMSLTKMQHISEHAQKMINVIYASHNLRDEANKFKFYISHDEKMLSEKDIKNGIIESKNDEMLIASGFGRNNKPIIIISPGLNKFIESFDHGNAVIQTFAIYQLLSILEKHRCLTLPNVTYDDKLIQEYANKFAVQRMSLKRLKDFKQAIENSVMKDSNYTEGLKELIGEEIQNRKK